MTVGATWKVTLPSLLVVVNTLLPLPPPAPTEEAEALDEGRDVVEEEADCIRPICKNKKHI